MQWASAVSGEQWREVTHITTPPFDVPNADEIKQQLHQHGCQIEEHQNQYILTFPPGTQKKRIGLVTIVERYTIHFPDGYEIRQEYDRPRGISLLFLPKE